MNGIADGISGRGPNGKKPKPARVCDMIPIKTMREEFGVAEKITPEVFRAELETRSSLTHYYFRSVRGVLPDLLTTSRDLDDSPFAVQLLEEVARQVSSPGVNPPCKIRLEQKNAYGFESALLLTPEYHGHLKGILDDRRKTLVYCVPVHDCEFTGAEGPDEYRFWQVRVGIENWARKPFPYVLMEFENPGSKFRSALERVTLDVCIGNLSELQGVRAGHAVIRNARGETVRIETFEDGRYAISGAVECDAATLAESIERITSFVRGNHKGRNGDISG